MGDANHTDSEVGSVNVTIAKYDIANATANAIDDYPYTGSQITPTAPLLKMGDTIIYDSDYDVTYGENINVGTSAGSVIYTAKSTSVNFTGTKTVTFNIVGGDGIGVIGMDAADGKNWYTVDGRKLQNKPTQKGIYVVNGKLVVVK